MDGTDFQMKLLLRSENPAWKTLEPRFPMKRMLIISNTAYCPLTAGLTLCKMVTNRGRRDGGLVLCETALASGSAWILYGVFGESGLLPLRPDQMFCFFEQ